MNDRKDIEFFDPGPLQDGDLTLCLVDKNVPDVEKQWVQSYGFELRLPNVVGCVGTVNLRVESTNRITMYAGHIGYWVDTNWRGNHFAERAVRLILPLAKRHRISPLWITCNPDNWPSRRTCERLGAELVEIVDLPADDEMYLQGERQKCRYRLSL